MTTIIADNAFVLTGDTVGLGSPVSIVNSWADRLAGTAFIEATPMTGFVVALSLDGPELVGLSQIAEDGTWEITGIAQRYASKELFVLGVSRDTATSYAIASRVYTV